MSERKKKVHVEEGESPIGFVMFGDLMSQMLCFFVLLFVFASQYTSKTDGTTYEDLLKKISDSFKKAVETEAVKKSVKEKDSLDKVMTKEGGQKEDSVEIKMGKELKRMLSDEKLKQYADVIIEEQKIRIVLQQPILFEPGKAELKPSALEVLAMIVQVIVKAKNPIDVEGHTDTDPIHTEKYDSNWDLSFDRAYNVIKFLVKTGGLSPLKVHAIGYGEFRPIAPNDTKENKARNRRIEINLYFREGVKIQAPSD